MTNIHFFYLQILLFGSEPTHTAAVSTFLNISMFRRNEVRMWAHLELVFIHSGSEFEVKAFVISNTGATRITTVENFKMNSSTDLNESHVV